MLASLTPIVLRAAVPDWLALAVVVGSVGLALTTMSFMLVRVRPVSTKEADGRSAPARDPVLLLSALGVVILAVAAWLLR